MAAGFDASELGRDLLRASAAAGLDLAAALSGDDAALRATEIAQPALVFTELVLTAALPVDLEIVGVAGHSVGEYAACAAAGAFDAETALRLVMERGRLMASMDQGTMAAVIGLDVEAVSRLCEAVRAAGVGTVVVANVNAPGQVVVSGTAEAVAAASAQARQAGAKRVVPLNVSGAFHSPLMAEASAAFAVTLAAADIRAPRLPVVVNVDAAAVTDPEQLRQRLAGQLEASVQWVDCVRHLAKLGAEAFVEVGPGSVLSGLARRILPGLPAIAVGDLAAAAGLRERLAVASHG